MVRPISTAVLLFGCVCQIILTTTDAETTEGLNPTHGVGHGNRRETVRNVSQATECEDIVERKDNVTLRGNTTLLLEPMNAPQCRDWCLGYVHCIAVSFRNKFCKYTVTTNYTLESKWFSIFRVYYKVLLRCPKHYQCADQPCKNGASCTSLSPGILCSCADGWSGWFCERRYSCWDMPCKNGATFRNSTNNGFSCSCVAGFKGSLCEHPYTEWSDKKKAIVVGAAVGGVIVTSVAAAVVSGTTAASGVAATTAAGTVTGTATTGTGYVCDVELPDLRNGTHFQNMADMQTH